MSSPENNDDNLKKKLTLETGKIPWKDLTRFFASGAAISVSSELNLVDVAIQMTKDNKLAIEKWMSEGKIDKVSDEQAKNWFDTDASVLAIVVNPWVLVQGKI